MAELNPPAFGNSVPRKMSLAKNAMPSSRSELFDLIAIVARKAREEDYDLEDAFWQIAKRLVQDAMDGDVKAAKLVLDRFFGPVEHAPKVQLEVDVDVNQTNHGQGPPIPSPVELRDNVVKLIELAQKGTGFEVVDAEFEEATLDSDEDDEESLIQELIGE